jgi:hypothetical protein
VVDILQRPACQAKADPRGHSHDVLLVSDSCLPFILLIPSSYLRLLRSPLLTSTSSQLSHLSDSLNTIIRIDPFSLLPREVNLRILGYLDAISLGRAAQVSKSWKALADDDLLWRRMCGQHIERKCEKCGWGLPLLERRRLKVELNEGSPAAAISTGTRISPQKWSRGRKHWARRASRAFR